MKKLLAALIAGLFTAGAFAQAAAPAEPAQSAPAASAAQPAKAKTAKAHAGGAKAFTPSVPELDLSEGTSLIGEFTAEAREHLENSEEAILLLENTPDDEEAINRIQGVDQTIGIIDACREYGLRSVNVDLIYGLPGQSLEDLKESISLRP